MSRNSIHVTMTAQLRRAQVRQRLDVLAERTGLPMAQIAGRALTIGLGHLEGDLQLLFPNPTALMPESLTASAPTVTEHTPSALMPESLTASAPTVTEHTPSAPMPEFLTASAPTVTEHTPSAPTPESLTASAPTVTEHTPSAPMPESLTAQPAESQVVPIQSADQPARVSSKDAARALNLTMPAFYSRLDRKPDLKRHAQIVGRSAKWDLAGLRAELAQ